MEAKKGKKNDGAVAVCKLYRGMGQRDDGSWGHIEAPRMKADTRAELAVKLRRKYKTGCSCSGCKD